MSIDKTLIYNYNLYLQKAYFKFAFYIYSNERVKNDIYFFQLLFQTSFTYSPIFLFVSKKNSICSIQVQEKNNFKIENDIRILLSLYIELTAEPTVQ